MLKLKPTTTTKKTNHLSAKRNQKMNPAGEDLKDLDVSVVSDLL